MIQYHYSGPKKFGIAAVFPFPFSPSFPFFPSYPLSSPLLPSLPFPPLPFPP